MTAAVFDNKVAESEFDSPGVYRPRAINGAVPRSRRTKKEMSSIREAIYEVVSTQFPTTVRQVFYQLVSMGVVGKTEAQYKTTVIRLLVEMRRAGEVPYGWIADNTRWMRKPTSYSSLEAALAITVETYRRMLWANQDVYVEVWLEKDALAGVVYDVTAGWDVPLMVTRGYPSLTYLHSAAEAIAAQRRPTFIYYFGDYDPSGVDIARHTEARLRELAPDAEIHFERPAVTPEQIVTWNLPTRPTKSTDTRSTSFEGESVELDAIPAATLRELVADHITAHVDMPALRQLYATENAEKDTLVAMLAGMRGSAWT